MHQHIILKPPEYHILDQPLWIKIVNLNVIYTDYIHLFQLSGMILLVAMIGAIVLTFRHRSGLKRQSYFKQISREKKDGVQVVDVPNNKGVKIDD